MYNHSLIINYLGNVLKKGDTMPKYTYRCKSCQERTEVNQSFDDPPMTHCLKCNGEMNRIITSGISIQFKGTGFYCTDHQKNN